MVPSPFRWGCHGNLLKIFAYLLCSHSKKGFGRQQFKIAAKKMAKTNIVAKIMPSHNFAPFRRGRNMKKVLLHPEIA